ncbi:hypothetical protein E4T56_gene11190 [Termitomyces sp. T112]|nr:hypothetical protein C0989_002580 [Termitomyces sp. Mn162]KAG5721701.1 hypothetical protein E4T56_gene11190 [Termitomyces sp. T112]KAH0585695.1 hypothetical protein H2248_008908 [Termitomyces sp. 'cryptogamus']
MASFAGDSISLPIELQYTIIDYLHSDFRSLAKCSAVCISWRLHSYKYKFARITLAWGSVLFFLELLKNGFSASAVIPSVRSVHIRGPPNALPTWDVQKMAAIQEILWALTASRNIRGFSLQNLAWILPALAVPSLNFSGLSTVSTLELLQISFYTRAELVAFLNNFHRLDHLVLEDVDCALQSRPPTISETLPPGSYGLALRCPQDFSLKKRLRWDSMTNHSGVSAEDLADLTMFMSERHHEIAAILPYFGPSLHRLQLSTQTIHTYPDAAINELDLSSSTSLKQLSLGSSKRVLALLPWVPLILRRLPKSDPPTLMHLEFGFASSRQFHLDRPILLIISDILMSPQFQKLQIIHFVVFDATGDRELLKLVKHTICETFASWRDKGAVSFTFTRQ